MPNVILPTAVFLELITAFKNILQRFSLEEKKIIYDNEYSLLNKVGLIQKAALGGLLVGPFHHEDGIPVIVKNGVNYEVAAEFEGYEYLMNEPATIQGGEILEKFNAQYPNQNNGFEEYFIPEGIRTIDCNKIVINGYEFQVLLHSNHRHWIINKFATKAGLETLNQLNEACISYLQEC